MKKSEISEPKTDLPLKASILLAARSAMSSKLIGRRLSDSFSVWNADNAENAWNQLLDQRDIALLICELGLALNQFGLLERIRNAGDNRLAATPVLILVGEDDSDAQRELAFRQGATDFINLPFAGSELDARVHLHTGLYLQQAISVVSETQPVSALNLLRQLAQENIFLSRVQQEISFSTRHRSPFSLCKLRLDDLKGIVVQFDKTTAFEVVQSVARVIQQTIRREDMLCYSGNAGFEILYPATNGIDACSAIQRILKNLAARKLKIAGCRVAVTLSAAVFSGIADRDTDLEAIMTQLDVDLAQAIARGGNQLVSNVTGGNQRKLSLDRALRLIESGRGDDLSEHAVTILTRLLPLLEFADAVLQLDLDATHRGLREKLGSVTATHD